MYVYKKCTLSLSRRNLKINFNAYVKRSSSHIEIRNANNLNKQSMKILLLLFLCLWDSSTVTGISRKCYVCNSFTKSENCTDPFQKDVAREYICDITNHVCVKERISRTDGGRDHIFRGCVSSEYCTSATKQPSSFCQTCNDDLCNSTPSLLYSLSILPAIIAVKYLFNY